MAIGTAVGIAGVSGRGAAVGLSGVASVFQCPAHSSIELRLVEIPRKHRIQWLDPLSLFSQGLVDCGWADQIGLNVLPVGGDQRQLVSPKRVSGSSGVACTIGAAIEEVGGGSGVGKQVFEGGVSVVIEGQLDVIACDVLEHVSIAAMIDSHGMAPL